MRDIGEANKTWRCMQRVILFMDYPGCRGKGSAVSKNVQGQLSRRDLLKCSSAATLVAFSGPAAAAPMLKPKRVAVVATIYQPRSHADVIVGKILEGWKQDGGPGPALELASLYIEQFPEKDISRAMAKKHGVPIFDTIEKAVTVGSKGIPVDGVISIGEHGDYPYNALGQHLYPRRRFFKEITDTFKKYDTVVPVFNDKHLGPRWDDAKWMYQRAREMKIPFMAGSSLPLSFRKPKIVVPMGCVMESAVGIGYSGLDIYGAHALDCYQSLVERRQQAESGVKWVQYLEGKAVHQAVADGVVPREMFEAAQSVVPKVSGFIPSERTPREALFLFQYRDGFLGAQFMLQTVGRTSVAIKLKGQQKPIATQFEERIEPSHPHFAYLLKGIERMMHTGRPSYPVERTLLTSGILDRALLSRSMAGKRLETPELAIPYVPVDYPHAPAPDLLSPPLG